MTIEITNNLAIFSRRILMLPSMRPRLPGPTWAHAKHDSHSSVDIPEATNILSRVPNTEGSHDTCRDWHRLTFVTVPRAPERVHFFRWLRRAFITRNNARDVNQLTRGVLTVAPFAVKMEQAAKQYRNEGGWKKRLMNQNKHIYLAGYSFPINGHSRGYVRMSLGYLRGQRRAPKAETMRFAVLPCPAAPGH
jgi:hypothetical protein